MNEIFIDVDKVVNKLNISNLFEDSITIIPLETSSECLISEIQKVIMKDNYLYIADRINQMIYVFDDAGRHIRNIGKRGGGSDEYSALGDFILIGDSVVIQDKFQNKILIYSNNGEYISNIRLKDISYVEFANIGRKLYFIASYERSDLGDYNLIDYDLDTQKYQSYLPYDNDQPLPWGLNKYISVTNEKALFILPRDHNIYEIDQNNISAKYEVRFSKNNVPSDLLKKEGVDVLSESLEKGYITGLDQIISSPNYLFMTFTDDAPRDVLFDMNNNENYVCDWFVMGDMGDLYVSQYTTTDDDEFIFTQDASMFHTAWKNIYVKGVFKDEKVKEEMKSLYNKLSEDDNPVVFRFKFK